MPTQRFPSIGTLKRSTRSWSSELFCSRLFLRMNDMPPCSLSLGYRSYGRTALRTASGRMNHLPGVPHALLQLQLAGLYERGVALLGDLHRSVAKQERNLIDGNARQQHLDRKGVAEHVRVAALDLAVRSPDISQLEKTTIASLPIGDRAFGIPIATPEVVAEIGFRTGRQILKSLDHDRRKRNIDRRSGFRLVEEEAVTMEAMPFEGYGIADAQPAPA